MAPKWRRLEAADRLKAAIDQLEIEQPLYRQLVAQRESLKRLLVVIDGRLGAQVSEIRNAAFDGHNSLPQCNRTKELTDAIGLAMSFSDAEMRTWLTEDNHTLTNTLRRLERELRAMK